MHKFLFRFIWNGHVIIVEGLFFCILGSLPFVFSNLACKVPLCPFKKQICVMCK